MLSPLVPARRALSAATGILVAAFTRRGFDMTSLSATPSAPARDTSFDMLKLFLTLLVVFHHAGQPYGPTGGEWPVMHAEKFAPLGPFFHINASFFMGLFFLISGYFLPGAYDRKGASQFLAERFRKFLIPILVFGLIVAPALFIIIVGKPWREAFLPFTYGHLWFLSHLLVYAVLYCAYRKWQRQPVAIEDRPFPSLISLVAYGVLLAVVDLVVRHWWPIDRWGRFILVAEVAHLPQYVSLFLFGVIAARYRWLERIPVSTGRACLGLFAAAILLRAAHFIVHFAILRSAGLVPDLLWELWEAAICVGACIGLIDLFGRHATRAGPLLRFAGRHAFALYVLHLPVLVVIQIMLERTSLGPLSLTVLSGLATTLLCLTLSGGVDFLVSMMKAQHPRLEQQRG
jgi:peptidoglycan/LPS O-acetylase OafA/YrhL